MIKNLSLTLENIAESTSKARAAQEKSLDSLAKVVLDNRIALDCLLAELGVRAMVNTTCCTRINTSGEVETQLYKITEQVSWLKKVTTSMGSFFDLTDFDQLGLEDHGSEVHS